MRKTKYGSLITKWKAFEEPNGRAKERVVSAFCKELQINTQNKREFIRTFKNEKEYEKQKRNIKYY